MARTATLPATTARRPAVSAEQTRAAILAAAIAVIARHSLSGTTVERVAAAAGVAPGTVILHFKRKEALLVETLEHLAQEFDQARRAAIAGAADDPVAALDRLIDINFDPEVSDPAKVAVWYAFWGEAGARSVYLERAGGIDNSYHADLVRICADLIGRGGYMGVDAEAAAVGLIGTIEYLWQEIMVAGRRFDRARARRTVRAYLANVFPRHFAVDGVASMEADVMNQQRPALPMASNASLVRGLPAWTYFNAELTALEYETLIRPSWQFVCHVNQLKQPGAFATLDMMRDSVIVMRGKDGVIRAFANACRHRGSRLLDGTGTCRTRITCPYHGWSYGLDGRLAAVPSEKTFRGIDKAEFGLKPVTLEILLGLVFVRVCGEGPSLAEMWGDFVEVARPYRLEEMEPADEPWIDTWQCNWKVAVDNNLENYHVPIGHPGYHRMLDNDLIGTINAHGIAYSKSVLREKPSAHWAERMYQKLAPEVLAGLPEEVRRTWLFFSMVPNIGIDIYPDSMDVFQILPNTAETCIMRYPIFVRPDARRGMKALRYLNGRINAQVGLEDQQLSERVQMGMRNHGFEPGPLSDYEHAIKDFHDHIRAACPVTMLPAAPAEGTLRARNAAMLAG